MVSRYGVVGYDVRGMDGVESAVGGHAGPAGEAEACGTSDLRMEAEGGPGPMPMSVACKTPKASSEPRAMSDSLVQRVPNHANPEFDGDHIHTPDSGDGRQPE